MSAPRGICEFCNRPVMDNDTAAFRVRGWEVERSAGGTNALRMRQRQANRIAHGHCVDMQAHLERRGLRGQESLL